MSSFPIQTRPEKSCSGHAACRCQCHLGLIPETSTTYRATIKTPSEPYLEPGVYYDPEEERAFVKETTTSPAAVGAPVQSTQIPSTAAAGALGQSAQIPTPTLALVNQALVFAYFKALIKYAL